MKNKILLLALVFTFSSCSIFQKTQTVSQNVETLTSEPEDSLQKFVGNYEIEVFGLPDGGDGKLSMKVSKESEMVLKQFLQQRRLAKVLIFLELKLKKESFT